MLRCDDIAIGWALIPTLLLSLLKKDRQRGKQLGTEMTAMLPQAKGCVRLLGVGRDKLFLRSFRGCRAC